MKSIIAMLMFTICSFSQPYVSVGTEVVNATLGTSDTEGKSKAHILLRVGAVTEGHFKLGLSFEHIIQSDYDRMTIDLGRRLYLGQDIEITPAINLGLMARHKDAFFIYSGEIETNYFLTKHFAISLVTRLNSRQDKDLEAEWYGNSRTYHFSGSYHLGVLYKFN